MQKKTIFALALLGSLPLAAPTAQAALAVGLTGAGLVSFDTDSPGTIASSVVFSGLGGDTIVDLDFRFSNQQLYGIAASGRLYTIDASTGSATVSTSAGVGPLGTVTNGDFNPAADRVRVYSSGDLTARLTPGTGAITQDGTLSYLAGDINAGANPNLGSSAYTNSFAGSTSTPLYSIDLDLDTLVSHPPSGAPGSFAGLNTVGELNLNGLSIDFTAGASFDIYYLNGVNTGYLTNGNALYEVDLATGDLSPLGSIGGPGAGFTVSSLAVVPEPGSALLTALPLGLMALRRKRRA